LVKIALPVPQLRPHREHRTTEPTRVEAPMLQQPLTDTVYRFPAAPASVSDTVGFADRLQASFANAIGLLFNAIPRILAFIITVAIGWFIASLIARGVTTLLRAIPFNEFAERTGVTRFTRASAGLDPSAVVAAIVKWLVRIVVLLVAFDLLGIPAVSDVLRSFLLWLPNLIVALFVLFIAGIASQALGNVVRGAATEADFDNPNTLANVARIGVWVVAIVVATTQLGIATALVNTIVTGAIGAIALAAGIAFGLGGREIAARRLEDWERRAGEARHKAADAARAARSPSPRSPGRGPG
jgi:hypothetical protein